jgi:hypothetical protein
MRNEEGPVMRAFTPDQNVRIAALMDEGPTHEWTVATPDVHVLFRCKSEEEATSLRGELVRLSHEEVLGLRVGSVRDIPDYIGNGTVNDPESRFCHWALCQLGHVSVLAVEEKGVANFSVKANSGQRAEGPTLAAALFGLVGGIAMLDRTQKHRNAKH